MQGPKDGGESKGTFAAPGIGEVVKASGGDGIIAHPMWMSPPPLGSVPVCRDGRRLFGTVLGG